MNDGKLIFIYHNRTVSANNVEIFTGHRWTFEYSWIDCITDYFPVIDFELKGIQLVNITENVIIYKKHDALVSKRIKLGPHNTPNIVKWLYEHYD